MQMKRRVQEEAAKRDAEATAGGGMVTVVATGAGEIKEIRIDPKAIDPSDPEMLADIVTAAANEALRSANDLMQAKVGMSAISAGCSADSAWPRPPRGRRRPVEGYRLRAPSCRRARRRQVK